MPAVPTMAETSARVRRLLDDYPWAGTTSRLALLGFDVEIRASDAGMAQVLAELYAPLRVPGTAEHVLSLSSDGDGAATRWGVHLDGVRLMRREAASIAFQHLLWEANRRAIDETHDLVLVHASAAVHQGRAIILPGPMGAGKSTLAAALLHAGLGYLTDEIVAIDPATGVVVPYPKYLSLGAALAHLVPERPAVQRSIVGDAQLVAPEVIRAGGVAPAARPRWIVFPRYERDASTTIEPMRAPAALAAIARHAFHLDDGPAALATLAAAVGESSCFELVSGDVDEARDALLGLVDDARERVRS
jgi:hypothetical protein